MRVRRLRWSMVLVIAVLVAGGCAADDAGGEQSAESEPATVESDAASEEDDATAEAVSEEASDADTSSGEVSLAEAEQAALDEIGDGEVTWSGPEDDRGTAWEIEVTQPDGTETDVLVAADGSIVKQVEKYTGTGGSSGAGDGESSGEVTLEDAEQIAVEAVGGGRVTWSGEEDERGARWEIEVTRPNGSEIDVLVDADGNVV